ncbi:MAG TPA: Ada metal-binding domain-containing protein [Candidatus Saccharimonadales bacterium]|nr:Ada metal-binding domain-containing protein [Candidatus Saccharimonadales bacterium]
MQFTPAACYNAVLAHDRRFDGVFFTCVISTGIYCRPICTAVTPRLQHCTFVATAADAERQGFRPCLRCRPERAPGVTRTQFTPAQGLAAYIDKTLLSDVTLSQVAENFRVSDRHLRRTFKTEFGVEPREYLVTRRLLFAKQLLQDSSLPIAQVAYAAGFGSPGRLTIQMQRHYNLTPRDLRRTRPASVKTDIILRTDYRPPLDWESTLQFLAGRATPNERVADGVYTRVIDSEYEVSVRNDAIKMQLVITIPVALFARSYWILQRVRRLFDLDANPTAIADVLHTHPKIGLLIKKYPGIRVPGCWEPFEMLLRVIIGQQVSVAGATTIMKRLIERIGITPDEVASHSPETIAAIGMPKKRGETIWRIAILVRDKKLNLDEMDPQIFHDTLTAQPGIGPWTAEYLKMRVLRWPDAFPSGDLGLQKAIDPPNRVTERTLIGELESVRPWRSYATMLLWRSLENKGG